MSRYNERNLPGYGDRTPPDLPEESEEDMKLAHEHVTVPPQHVEYWLYEEACKQLARVQMENYRLTIKLQQKMGREAEAE